LRFVQAYAIDDDSSEVGDGIFDAFSYGKIAQLAFRRLGKEI